MLMPINIALPTRSRFDHDLVHWQQEFSCHICIRLSSDLLASVSDLTKLVFNFAPNAELASLSPWERVAVRVFLAATRRDTGFDAAGLSLLAAKAPIYMDNPRGLFLVSI